MYGLLSYLRRACLAGGAAALALLGLAGLARPSEPLPVLALPAAEPNGKAKDEPQKPNGDEKKDAEPAPVPSPPGMPIDLAGCRRIALEHQPALAAASASLEAARARAHALDSLRVPTCLVRDLPTRRQQAALGVSIAEGHVLVAQNNTLYGVDFSYLTYLYARQQLELTLRAEKNLLSLRRVVAEAVKEGTRRDLSERDLEKLRVYLLVAQGRREEAAGGSERALSALREAMGVGPEERYVPLQSRMLDARRRPERATILALAVARRAEVVQAQLGAQVGDLEVHAQGARHFGVTVPTYASGSDIHAQPLPAGSFDQNYSPAAVGPEMPMALNGRRSGRVDQAQAYSARAAAVADKTRGLVALEAEQAFLRWDEAAKKLERYEKAARRARKVFNDQFKQFTPTETKVGLDPLLNNAILSTQLEAQVNQVRHELVLALAALERATAGGFKAGLEVAPVVPEDENGNGNGKDNGK